MIRFKHVLAVCISIFIVGSGSPVFAGTSNNNKKVTKSLATQTEKISYSLGYNIGNNLKNDFEIDLNSFLKGFKDSHSGAAALLTKDEMKHSILAFQQQIREKQMKKIKVMTEKNKADGTAFLTKNKAKKGVVALPSGLQYKILKKGSGASPLMTNTVECNYRGTTIDGKEFDSSYKRGKSAKFKVNGVIKGWTEALQHMKVGSKWMLYVPSDLAYGDHGAGSAIQPGSTLIFEVELLGIEG